MCAIFSEIGTLPDVSVKNILDNMNGGGLGPAACWLAHKRLESWSRIAKERVGAVRKSSEKSEDDKSDAATPPLLCSSASNSISSSTEVNKFCRFTIFLVRH